MLIRRRGASRGDRLAPFALLGVVVAPFAIMACLLTTSTDGLTGGGPLDAGGGGDGGGVSEVPDARADAPAGDGSAAPDFCTSGKVVCATPPCSPTPFAALGSASVNLRVHDGWVYWSSGGDINRQPETGGNIDQQRIVSGQAGLRAFVADKDGLYWVRSVDGKLSHCSLSGVCTPTEITTGPTSSLNERASMASDDARVYWTTNLSPGGVFGIDKLTGVTQTYGTDPAQYVTVDAERVYWLSNCSGAAFRDKAARTLPQTFKIGCTNGAGGVAVGSDAVFFGVGSAVVRLPLGEGALAPTAGANTRDLVADCGQLYYVTDVAGGADLVRLPRVTDPSRLPAPETVLRGGGTVTINGLAASPSALYMIVNNAIVRFPRE